MKYASSGIRNIHPAQLPFCCAYVIPHRHNAARDHTGQAQKNSGVEYYLRRNTKKTDWTMPKSTYTVYRWPTLKPGQRANNAWYTDINMVRT